MRDGEKEEEEEEAEEEDVGGRDEAQEGQTWQGNETGGVRKQQVELVLFRLVHMLKSLEK